MFFGSKHAYISRKKIDKIQSSAPPKSEPLPVPQALPSVPKAPLLQILPEMAPAPQPEPGYVPPMMPMSVPKAATHEERMNAQLSTVMEERPKSRSRSRSISSVEDENLDQFHSDEEEIPQAEDEKKRKSSREKMEEEMPATKEKSSGGFFSAIGSLFSSKKKESEEEKKSKKDKKEYRMRAAMERHQKMAPQMPTSAMPRGGSIPLSLAKGSAGVHHEQEVDTNVLSLNLSVLKDKTAIATGDPVYCTKCKAMFNVHSTLVKVPLVAEQTWTCEFCNTPNKVLFEEEEIPKAEELTYVIESAQQAMIKKGGGEDISLIFCIDVSGSMCVSQLVHGKMNLKYDKVKKLQDLMKFSDGSYQYMSGESTEDTYISRMQCVQTAIEQQFKDIANGAPKRKIGVVTFNNEVTLYGDGTLPPKTIAGDKLLDYEGLLTNSQKDAEAYMTKPISVTQKTLVDRLGEIEEMGQTALGPALLVSLGVALKGSPGSRVIICTDGLANVGLGSVEDLATEEAFNKAKEFYTKIGELAKSKGVQISIISIVGEECKLEMLSPLADLTGGDIYKVDPVNLSNDFANILSEAVIATNVEVRVKLHKGFTFRNENPLNITEDGTLLIRSIGNATNGQEVTLEYSAKPSKELKEMKDIDLTKTTKLPFQTQISYRSLDGMKCVRLITKLQDLTFEREEAKKAADYHVLSVNAVQQTAKLAREGNYRGAQANAYHWKKMMKGSDDYEDYMVNAAPLYQALERQQMDELEEAHMPPSSAPKSKMHDYVVSEVSQASKMNYKKMSKK